VIAVEPSRLLVLRRADFREHIAAHPRTALRAFTELARRLRRADELIGDLALLDVVARLTRKLRQLAAADGERVEAGVVIRRRPTQAELAAMIGCSRETVSRALGELAHRGLLRLRGKGILLQHAFFGGVGR
jgi:CRP/FNR family transcriptional regulator, cyclic AMP receptor protein